jgi:hypothetical protein
MTLLTDATDVFSAAGDGRCAVAFLVRRHAAASLRDRSHAAQSIAGALQNLGESGWRLCVRVMLEESAQNVATAYATGFAHDTDFAGMFEAPSLSAALAGTVALERAGWSHLFATEWLVGPREFAAVRGTGPAQRRDWGFLALWEWNDAWAAATPEARRAYDAECDLAFADLAFAADVALGIDIAGRHRLDWASRWHHLGMWETDSPGRVDEAMREHERVADFKFTTSRHYLGQRRPLLDLLQGDA